MGKQQKYIKRAFLDLLKENDLHSVSIRQLVQKADVSRSCFYSYYSDKYELLQEIEDELIAGFVVIMKKVRQHSVGYFYEGITHRNYPIYTEYFTYIKQHQEVFTILFSARMGDDFTNRFSRAIAKTRHDTLRYWHLDPEPNPWLAFQENLLAASYVSIIKTWLNQDCQPSIEEMGAYLSTLWRPGFFYNETQYQRAVQYMDDNRTAVLSS